MALRYGRAKSYEQKQLSCSSFPDRRGTDLRSALHDDGRLRAGLRLHQGQDLQPDRSEEGSGSRGSGGTRRNVQAIQMRSRIRIPATI